jgi:hypothetical protein
VNEEMEEEGEVNGEKEGIVDRDEGDDCDDEDGGEGEGVEADNDREIDVGAKTPSSGSTGKKSAHVRDEYTYPRSVRVRRVSAA